MGSPDDGEGRKSEGATSVTLSGSSDGGRMAEEKLVEGRIKVAAALLVRGRQRASARDSDCMSVLCGALLGHLRMTRQIHSALGSNVLRQMYYLTACLSYSRVLALIGECATDEVRSISELRTLFRNDSPSTFWASCLFSSLGRSYLQTLLRPVLQKMVKSNKSMEVDPSRIPPTNFKRVMEKQRELLLDTCERILQAVFASIPILPSLLRQCAGVMVEAVREGAAKRGWSGEPMVRITLVNVYFLRFLCPALISPCDHGLIDGTPSSVTQRNLTLVAKALQSLANGASTKNFKEPHMEDIQKTLSESQEATMLMFFEAFPDFSLHTPDLYGANPSAAASSLPSSSSLFSMSSSGISLSPSSISSSYLSSSLLSAPFTPSSASFLSGEEEGSCQVVTTMATLMSSTADLELVEQAAAAIDVASASSIGSLPAFNAPPISARGPLRLPSGVSEAAPFDHLRHEDALGVLFEYVRAHASSLPKGVYFHVKPMDGIPLVLDEDERRDIFQDAFECVRVVEDICGQFTSSQIEEIYQLINPPVPSAAAVAFQALDEHTTLPLEEVTTRRSSTGRPRTSSRSAVGAFSPPTSRKQSSSPRPKPRSVSRPHVGRSLETPLASLSVAVLDTSSLSLSSGILPKAPVSPKTPVSPKFKSSSASSGWYSLRAFNSKCSSQSSDGSQGPASTVGDSPSVTPSRSNNSKTDILAHQRRSATLRTVSPASRSTSQNISRSISAIASPDGVSLLETKVEQPLSNLSVVDSDPEIRKRR